VRLIDPHVDPAPAIKHLDVYDSLFVVDGSQILNDS
jgi:hypothetical protein